MRRSLKECDSDGLQTRREHARHTIIFRVGVLEQDGRSSMCLVKNISAKGVQLKIYSPAVEGAGASIRVADEPPVHGRLVWVKDDIAGIAFENELDAATLLRVRQKLRPNRRRAMPRILVDASAILRSGGRTCRAAVCDISSVGARVRTRNPLTMGDRAMVSFTDMAPISAFIRWVDGDEAGLAFDTPIPLPIIAGWVSGRVRVSA